MIRYVDANKKKEEIDFEETNRTLRLLFNLLGGMYTSKEVPTRVKQAWIFVNTLNILIMGISGPFYYAYMLFYAREPFEIVNFLVCAQSVSIVLQIVVYVPLITYSYQDELTYMFEYLDKLRGTNRKFSPYESATIVRKGCAGNWGSPFIRKLDPITLPLTMLSFTTSMCLFYLVTPIITAANLPTVPQKLEHHIFAIPFYDLISSFRVYYLISFGEFLLGTTLAVAGSIHPAFFLIVCRLLNNAMVEYCERIRRLACTMQEQLERMSRESTTTRSNSSSRTMFRRFKEDVNAAIDDYADFTQFVREIRSYVNIFFTMMLCVTVATQFCNIYFTLGTNLNLMFKIKQLLFGVCVAIYLYVMCHIGKIFDDMGEAVRYEVYNLPWYRMSPQMRKTILILQNVVLKHEEFKVFVSIPVTMALFPRVMQAVYSVFNLFRTALNRNTNK